VEVTIACFKSHAISVGVSRGPRHNSRAAEGGNPWSAPEPRAALGHPVDDDPLASPSALCRPGSPPEASPPDLPVGAAHRGASRRARSVSTSVNALTSYSLAGQRQIRLRQPITTGRPPPAGPGTSPCADPCSTPGSHTLGTTSWASAVSTSCLTLPGSLGRAVKVKNLSTSRFRILARGWPEMTVEE
jgi:hypothetical protein